MYNIKQFNIRAFFDDLKVQKSDITSPQNGMYNNCLNQITVRGTYSQFTEFKTRFLDQTEQAFSFYYVVPFLNNIRLFTPERSEGGYYTWQQQNQGILRDASNVDVYVYDDAIEIIFSSTYSPPMETLTSLTLLMPQLHIKHMYQVYIDNRNISGLNYYHGGQLVQRHFSDISLQEGLDNPLQEAYDYDDDILDQIADYEENLKQLVSIKKQVNLTYNNQIYLKRIQTLKRYSRVTLIRYLKLHGLQFKVGMSKMSILQIIQSHFIKLLLSKMTCPICMETFVDPMQIPCKHVFCQKCLKHWKTLNNKCPLCRTTF